MHAIAVYDKGLPIVIIIRRYVSLEEIEDPEFDDDDDGDDELLSCILRPSVRPYVCSTSSRIGGSQETPQPVRAANAGSRMQENACRQERSL